MLDITYDPPNRPRAKPLKWIVFDSLVIAAIAFIAALPPDRLPDILDFYIAIRAFGYAFFAQLIAEKSIKPYWERRRSKK